MHYHLEIVLPPVENVEEAVKQILAPFDENLDDGAEHASSHRFWDFYVIGGRWAGAKLQAALTNDRIEEFYKKIREAGITVSGLQAGKQELSPASQIPLVDQMWNEMFPESPVKVCPLFKHFNDQYKNSVHFPDVMPLRDVSKDLKSESVIVAGPHYSNDGRMEAKTLLKSSIWNGVTWQDTKWDGLLLTALAEHADHFKNALPDRKKTHVPSGGWLVVTVDYHS